MEQNKKSSLLNIVVLGANGGIGSQAVLQALKAGHKVTAILRTPDNLKFIHPNLQIVQGDVLKPDALEEHLKNKDVVISAIGKNSLNKTTLYSQGNQNLIAVLKKTGTNRVFFISASGLEINPTYSLIMKFIIKFILQKLLRKMYADLWKMESIIKESKIDWTIMRPPKLTNGPETEKYRFEIDGFLNQGLKISRADVAHFIIHNLNNEAIIKKTVEVAY